MIERREEKDEKRRDEEVDLGSTRRDLAERESLRERV